MERKDKILTQEEYAEITAEILRLKMMQSMTGKDYSAKIAELKSKIS